MDFCRFLCGCMCVSLVLQFYQQHNHLSVLQLIFCRDMKKPISVLTGLDYWLDNLMCNVPELAMCYHDNGIVQVSNWCVCTWTCVGVGIDVAAFIRISKILALVLIILFCFAELRTDQNRGNSKHE